MVLDFPVWPVAEFERPPELMTIAEIENFAPLIPCELDDDATLQDALSIPGGLSIFCHRQRLRDEAAGLVAVNTHHKKERSR